MIEALLILVFLFILYLVIEVGKIKKLIVYFMSDINEIKAKLGLEVYHLTKEQQDEELLRSFIERRVFEGIKNQTESNLGFWFRLRHREWISYCIRKFYQEYPKTKRCPECKTVVSEFFAECPDCKVKLVSDWVKEKELHELKELAKGSKNN